MNLIAIIGFILSAAFLAVLLRRHTPESAIAISLGVGIIVLGVIVTQISPVITRINSLLSATSQQSEYITVLFKALGVCILTQLASDSCKDAGESSLAEKAELAGKVSLLLLALPLFEEIARIATALING